MVAVKEFVVKRTTELSAHVKLGLHWQTIMSLAKVEFYKYKSILVLLLIAFDRGTINQSHHFYKPISER